MFLWAHERQLHRLGRTLPYMQETSHFSWCWCKNRRYIPTFAIIKPRTHTTEFHMSSVICRARYSHCLLRLFKKSKINPQVRQRGAPDTNTLINIKNLFKARFLHSSLIIYKLNCNKQRLINEVKFYLMSIKPWFVPSFDGSCRYAHMSTSILCCDQFSKLSWSLTYLKVIGVFWFTT